MHALNSRDSSRTALVVVRLGTLLLTLLAILFVAKYGRSVPIWDDFMIVAPLTGQQSLLPWLWAQHNFHRIPLPKLIYFLCIEFSNWDFRTSMFLSVIVLGITAWLLTEAARRLRGGRARYCDLFFPLILLHGGHAANMLLSSQIDLVLPVALICVILVVVLAAHDPLPARLPSVLAVVLVVVFLSGGFGLPFLLTYGLWLIWIATRSEPGKRIGRLILGLIPIALLGVYFVGYHKPPKQPAFPGIGQSLMVAIEAMTTCFGTAAKPIWIKIGPAFGIVTVAIVIAAIGIPLWVWMRKPSERARAGGLLAFVFGLIGLMLGIGWSRGRLGPLYGFQPRYVTLATPLLICCYFIAQLYLAPVLSRIVRVALCTLAVALFLIHIRPTLHYGSGQSAMQDAFIRDVRAGVPRQIILDRYVPGIEEDEADLNDHLDRLHAHHIDGY